MKNDNFIDFGEEISRTIRKVLNNQEFYDLKNTISRTMQNGQRMSRGPFYQEPYNPRLSKEYRSDAGNYGSFSDQGFRAQRKKSKGGSFLASTLLLVFGFIGAFISGLTAVVCMAVEASIGNVPALTVVGSSFGILFLASLGMVFTGFKIRNRTKRYQRYLKVLNGRTYCMIQELSKATGQEQKFIIKDLRKMIKAGLFTEAYLDEQDTCLMTDYKTYVQYLETMENVKAREEAEKRDQEKWAGREDGGILKDAIDEGKEYIRTIKAANDALPEEEISEKLERLENITSKIFEYVEQHPEKLPEIRKFMCYYMPITLKLVKAYQSFDEHGGNEGEIADAKAEIKKTLETINMAYQNLFKKLMQTDILDVSSDISALETILAQEGLTEESFMK
ncbi:MAG: 5-bromo-4-chloroindolyl phosphate hydrolysis protein [Clostridiales bacterium]|jgi:5-bromo-4-chloroindolyl phosphate hydrolysis protein|uniref:5-bromo-4-chloroindolyl phosphate hydrolysis family protein n=1 Tax=Aminipila sp. TaxID=2060095 RepID=UPI001D953F6B|nr:5-bromo-4-chloroindolyl phosphate hydrolysis family protein [Aminipila sp.]MBE6035931.1 5-bromo-4-chloroindolyl phosphate hydrolysis protein [Clostridiales bacterium]